VTRTDPERHAVVVGSAIYDDPGLTTYPTVANSAARLKKLFDASGLWRSCVLVNDPRLAVNVMLPIRRAAQRCAQGDTLLVYFIGHAVNPLRTRHSDILLALRTTSPDEYWSYLSLYHIYDMMRQSRATSKVLILDCCYCGQAEALGVPGTPRPVPDPAWLPDEANTCVLKAVGADSFNQRADPYLEQDPSQRYTAFSGYLISILENGIAGVRDPLQVRDVYNELRRVVPASGVHPEPELLIRNEPWIVLMENRHPAAILGPPADAAQLARLRAATAEDLAEAMLGKAVTLSGLPRALIDDYVTDLLPRADAETVQRITHRLHAGLATVELAELLPLVRVATPENVGAAVCALLGHGCGECRAFAGQVHAEAIGTLEGACLHRYAKAAAGD
jgi:hypothetical protein